MLVASTVAVFSLSVLKESLGSKSIDKGEGNDNDDY